MSWHYRGHTACRLPVGAIRLAQLFTVLLGLLALTALNKKTFVGPTLLVFVEKPFSGAFLFFTTPLLRPGVLGLLLLLWRQGFVSAALEQEEPSTRTWVCTVTEKSRWHNRQKVVGKDPHIKDIFGFVASTLKPLYDVQQDTFGDIRQPASRVLTFDLVNQSDILTSQG